MTDRIHVTMRLDLLVDDEQAMREAAFERLRGAWSSDDDFPYDSASDVPLGEVLHSLLADALPTELPGCRRSQLEVETETAGSSEAEAEAEADSTTEGEPGRSSDEGSTDDSSTDNTSVRDGDSGSDDRAEPDRQES